MVAAVNDPYRSGATRSELTLGRIGQSWSARLRGARFIRALTGFIGSGGSRHTTRTYAYAVLGLWEWLDSVGRGLPTPDELTRDDAVDYERWLRESGENLIRYRLAADPARAMDLAIYDYAMTNAGCTVRDIRDRLLAMGRFSTGGTLYVDQRCKGGLHRYLGAMVINKALRREPTVEQVRSMPEYREVLRSGDVADVFRYYPGDGSRPDEDRVCGNATRIGVLAAFWAYMAAQGENRPGSEEPLLRFNVWAPVLKRVREQAESHQADRRAVRTPGGELFARVLATTYRSSHGDAALQAAEAAIRGEVIPSTRGKFADLRDRALLLVMLQAGGPRASEVQGMRREDISDDLATLTIRGKRNKVRTVPVPPAAADAIARMTGRIAGIVERRRSQGKRVERFEELLLPSAPLLPGIRYWGANRWADESCGLTRAGIAMRLRHLAKSAGLAPGSQEFAQMHPHGIRRLFAKMEMASGTPLNVLQAKMGHSSGATTLRYAEERDVESLRTAAFGGAARVGQEAIPGRLGRVQGPVMPPEAPEPERRALPPSTAYVEPERPVPEPIPTPSVVRVVREQTKPARRREPEAKTVAEACAIVPVGAARTLCDVYESTWGERGNRQRITKGKGVQALRGEAAVMTAMMPVEVVDQEFTAFGETKRMEHVYAGKSTGLVWWAGTNGDLSAEMPVPSLAQLGEECGPETRSALCQRLVGLWSEWSENDERGPTAASALGMWVAEFLETAAQVDQEITARDGLWLEHLAPIEETKLGGTKREPEARSVFREHSEDRIMEWFRNVAWQYRTSTAREDYGELEASKRPKKVVGAAFRPPPWYALEDPLADLPPPDRDDALDLVAALTRGVLVSRAARWGALSRKGCSDLMHAISDYDKALDDLREAKHKSGTGPEYKEARAQAVAAKEREAAQAAVLANTLFVSLGAPQEFSIIKAVTRRVKTRRAAMQKRRSVWRFHLDVIRDVFGDGPADDVYVALVARHMANPPLQGKELKDLLDPDWDAGTIRHPPEVIREWALKYGTHSECVGRRLARHMWELFVSARGRGPFSRRDELVNYVTSMAAYRVPCPASMEAKLRALLRWEKVDIPIYEKWSRAFGTSATDYPELPSGVYGQEQEPSDETRAAFEEFEDYGENAFRRNPESLPLARASKSLPNPLLLLLLLIPFVPP